MPDITKQNWITSIAAAAFAGGHIYPHMAAAEAALESNFGQSMLGRQDSNLFGMKQHQHPVYGTHNLPTREFENGEWVVVNASWIHYPDLKSCFADRMATLERLAPHFPHYAAALAATDQETYVLEVSQTWSSDPQRGQKCISIHNLYFGVS